jgi:two-component system response regulator YesN
MMEITINEQCMPFTRFTEFTLSEVKDLIMYGMHVFGTLGNDSYDPKVKETIHYILWNYADFNLSIKTLADHVELSQNYLCALFKQYTGTTINNIMIEVRLEKTKKLLRTTDLRMYEIASKVGMSDPNYLSSVFKQRLGMTPSQYRDRQGKGFND